MGTNRMLVLRRRPEGLLRHDDVELVGGPVPVPGEREALVEVGWLGIDATVRSWLSEGEGYLPPVGIGEVVRCSGIGRVVSSRVERFPEGSLVMGLPGWQTHAIATDDMIWNSIPAGVDAEGTLALYGATGLTAYLGMVDVGRVQPGETVVVSAAAGATGSVAAQIAKIHGARVIGIAGGDEKCRWLVDDLGLDGAIDHRADDVAARLRELCPQRIDVYFDNVGGPLLDAVLARLANGGRVVLCGAISMYNERHRPPGPSNYVNLINRRGRMEGFLALDHIGRIPEVAAILAGWVGEGRLRYRTHVFDGLESAPDALNAMFTGENVGKIVVRL
jgi:hypothetical protein